MNDISKQFFSIFLLLSFIPAKLFAIELQYSINSNLRHSNNLTERPEAVSGNALTNGITFNITNDPSSDWTFELNGNFENVEFSTDEFINEKRKDAIARLLYDPSQSNFDLIVFNNYSQVPRNRFTTQELNNLREINVAVIRPRYFFKLSPLDQVTIDYTHINFENLNASEDLSILYGTRISRESSFGYEKKLSSTSSLGIYQNTVDTHFEEAVNDSIIDFDQVDKFLRWQTLGQNTQLILELGVSDVTNILRETARSNLKRITFNRQINRTQSLSIRHQAGFDTVFNSNLATNSININSASSDFGTAQDVQESSVEYSIAGSLLSTNLSYIDRKTSSAIEQDSEERKEIFVFFEYSLSQLFQLPQDTSISISYRKFENDFDTIFSEITESKTDIYRVRYSHPINRQFIFYSEFSKRHSEDDNPLVTNDIDANSIEIGLIFTR